MKERTKTSQELWDHEKQYLTVAEMLQLAEYGYKSMLREKTNIELWNLYTETFNFGKD
jgi:hypothetical protein